MKMKEKIFMALIIGMLVLCAGIASAFEMPDLSVDGYMLYDINSKTTSAAPGVSATIIRFADQIIEGNIGVAFPADRDYVAGPIVDVNLVKLGEKIKGAEIVTENLKLTVGAGVMVDLLHLSNRTLKEIAIPTLHVRFMF
jgi:hypothetical protein